MLLKKQTVWLLTMLSLVVVLSVYYLTSPDANNNMNTATTEQPSGEEGKAAGDEKEESNDDSVTISSGDEFAALRMQIEDERSKLNEELTEQIANTELSEEEILEAQDQIKEISAAKTQELILEDSIVSMDYEAALVRINDNNVMVTVKAKEHSKEDANKIIRLVRGEVADANDVSVEFKIDK